MDLPKWRVQLERIGLKTDPECGEMGGGACAVPPPAVLLKDSGR